MAARERCQQNVTLILFPPRQAGEAAALQGDGQLAAEALLFVRRANRGGPLFLPGS
jgi:hypothetical protein